MRVLSLFSGVGGIELGLEQAGHDTVALCEIDQAARSVLRRHWPGVPLYQDVRTLKGADLVKAHGRIDLVSGGSPCQDLSTAGKRQGLAGIRSALFFEQLRVWQEVQAAQPTVPVSMLWENVLGALTSQNGADFAAVLSGITGAPVPPNPEGTTWASAGVASGPAAVAGWRVLDLQFFGMPQIRRRVFVISAPPGGPDPRLVLSLAEIVRKRPARGGAAGQGNTGPDAEGPAARPEGDSDLIAPSLNARDGKGAGSYFNGGIQATVLVKGRLRRLLPQECERVMGWPDQHTRTGVRENGKPCVISNTARYKLCGNGAAAPQTAWLGWQLHYATH